MKLVSFMGGERCCASIRITNFLDAYAGFYY